MGRAARGGSERITEYDVLDLLKEYAVNAPIVLDIEPEGDHCCHNLGPAPRLRMADWLATELTS